MERRALVARRADILCWAPPLRRRAGAPSSSFKTSIWAGPKPTKPDPRDLAQASYAAQRPAAVAAPLRAQSLGRRTPCAEKADRCYDCSSPERVCRGLTVVWGKPNTMEHMEVVLIEESLGM